MSKFAEKGVQQKEIGSTRTNGIGKKVYDAINFVLDLTKDSLVDPHTSLDDCLNAYFGSCELKGMSKRGGCGRGGEGGVWEGRGG